LQKNCPPAVGRTDVSGTILKESAMPKGIGYSSKLTMGGKPKPKPKGKGTKKGK
jgi:hypothetical protein